MVVSSGQRQRRGRRKNGGAELDFGFKNKEAIGGMRGVGCARAAGCRTSAFGARKVCQRRRRG